MNLSCQDKGHISISSFPSLTNLSPSPHTNHKSKRLPQESLPRLQLSLVLVQKLVVPEDSPYNARQFHLGHVPPYAGPGPVAERDEGVLLLLSEAVFVPSVGNELVRIGTPDFLRMMDGIGRDGECGAWWEGVAEDLDRHGIRVLGSSCGDEAGEAEGGRAVDT